MEKNNSNIIITIKDKQDGLPIKPSNIDIADLKDLITDIEKLVRQPLPDEDKKSKIVLEYKEGSLILDVRSKPFIIRDLVTDIFTVIETNSFLTINKFRAAIFTKWQKKAKKGNERSYEFKFPGFKKQNILSWTLNKESAYSAKAIWVDIEMNVYGLITDIGGASNPNIHIDTESKMGFITIGCSREDILSEEKNLLYKYVGVRVKCKQNIHTLEYKNIKFIEYIDYPTPLENQALTEFIELGTEKFSDVEDSVNWVRNRRD